MKLSIITVNLNNAGGLEKTISSVVSQSSDDFEFIIIDGCSTDGSVDVIKKFSARINCWISERDSGIYNAMNKGIKMASGEYCLFLNSGDYLASRTVIENLLSKIPEDCGILYGNMLKIYPDKKIRRDNNNGLKTLRLLQLSKKVNLKNNIINSPLVEKSGITLIDMYSGTINHSSAVIKKTLFDKYGCYDENYKIVSDWKFFLMCVYNSEKIYYSNQDISVFDNTGISNKNRSLIIDERTKVLKEVLPESVITFFLMYNTSVRQICRINSYPLISHFVWFAERFLFKIEKFRLNRFNTGSD